MRIRVFTLKFNPALERFDDEELQEFIKDKELLSAREHFFVTQETPYLAVFLSYHPGGDMPEKAGKKRERKWQEALPEGQLPLFNSLRDWRAKRAKQEGVPAYLICTNIQFAEMIALQPAAPADLEEIQGFGEKKLEKYGQEIFTFLRNSK